MKICHVVYAYFPSDPRVRREVDSLRAAGHEVHVICLRGEGEGSNENIRGTHVLRVPLRARRGGGLRYAFQYALFLLLSSARLLALHNRTRLHAIHVHSLPDFQVFCALPLRVRGVPVVLDLHEALPEIAIARLRLSSGSLLARMARVAERLSVRFADRVITVNEAVKDLVSKRSRRTDIVVIMNSPDAHSLQVGNFAALRRQLGLNSHPAVVYVGGINPERDLETLLRAVSALRERFPIQVVIAGYGDREYLAYVRDFASKLPFSDPVQFLPRIPQDEVMTYLNLSSIGVVSYKESPLTHVAIPTKVFEYAAAGKPMAIARLGALASLFKDAAEFFRPGDAADLASAIERILTDQARSRQFVVKAREVLERCSWTVMEARLLSIYSHLESMAR